LPGSRRLAYGAFWALAFVLTSCLGVALDAQGLFRHCLEYPQEYLGSEMSLVDGAEISRRWYVANPEQGVYDWSEIDDQIAYLAGLGKLSALKVYTACPPKWRLWDEESVTPHWVYAFGADKCGPYTAYMRLGDPNQTNDQANGNGVPDLEQRQVAEDGMTVASVKGLSKCRGTNRAGGHEYIYFDLDDDLFYDVDYPLTVAVSYFDDGTDTFELQYDSRTVVSVAHNASMEESSGGQPTDWQLWADSQNHTTFTQDTWFSRRGAYSGKISCTEGAHDTWSSISQHGKHLAVQKGASYRLSAWVRAAKPGTLVVKFYRYGGAPIASKTLSVGTELAWYQMEFTCLDASLDNAISFSFPGVNDVWIDEVMFVAMGGENPYRSAGVISRSGTGQWKTAQWHISDARFRNCEASSCDLRIACGQESDVYIRYIDVHKDKTQVEPAYWDPVYQQCYGQFIAALGAKYDTNENVAYTIASFGPWGEISAEFDDCHVRQGYTLAGYLDYVSFVAQRYRTAFPDKLLSAPVGGIYDQDGWHGTEAMEEIPAYLASLGYMIDFCGGDGDPADGNWYDDYGRSVPGTISYLYLSHDGLVPTCSESTGWQKHTDPEDVWRWIMHMLCLKADSIRAYKEELVLNPWAFEFAKLYLGKTVETTDGVWIGLRRGDRGNYDFFLTQDDLAPGGQTRVTDGHNKNTWIGGKECRYTNLAMGWNSIYFNIDDDFACGTPEAPATISVTYFDSGTSTFVIEYDSQEGNPYKVAATVQLENTHTWRTAECVIDDGAFANGEYGNDFRIRAAGSDNVYVHFVWVRRVSGIGGPPSDPPPDSPAPEPDDPPGEPESASRSAAAATGRPQNTAITDGVPVSNGQNRGAAESSSPSPRQGGDWVVWCAPASAEGCSADQGAATQVAGRECWSTDLARGHDSLSFEIAGDSLSKTAAGAVIATVAYFDAGSTEFAIEYPVGAGEYKAARTVRLSGSNVWKTVSCEIPRSALSDGDGHIRIRATGRDDVYLHFVMIRPSA
jgi:hypothetical protein